MRVGRTHSFSRNLAPRLARRTNASGAIYEAQKQLHLYPVSFGKDKLAVGYHVRITHLDFRFTCITARYPGQ